jgi:hypothetical protein
VVITDLPENNVAVTENTADLAEGPLSWMFRVGSGPWDLEVGCTGHRGFLAYLDADDNGYFEPSDPVGEASSNPIPLGLGDVGGVTIPIPDIDVDVPVPPAYIGVTGTVTYPAFSTGDILVKATHVTTDGYLFSQITLASPGAFALLAPLNQSDVLVWAVLDEDGDGEADPAIDPSAAAGPMDSGNGISGLLLDLGPSAPGSITGSISYSGAVSPGDVLHVGLFDTETYSPADGPPVDFLDLLNPAFPVTYLFDEVESGTYWVGTYLDLGANNPNQAGPEDPESQIGPVLLAPGGEETGRDLTLF